MPTPIRSRLPGELAASIDRALEPGEEIVHELNTYRGYGIVLTREHLLLVVGGVLAGLKAHEQHVHRLELGNIKRFDIELDRQGCLTLAGPPLLKLIITPVDPTGMDERWDVLVVEFKHLDEAIQLACQVYEGLGRRRLLEEQAQGR